MTLPFRVHTWLGTFQLDDGRHARPPNAPRDARMPLVLREVAEDAIATRWLVLHLPEVRGRPPPEIAKLVADACDEGRIAFREIERSSAPLDFTDAIVDLKDLQDTPPEAPASNASPQPAASTRFEVRIVDELGEPLPDIALLLQEDGGGRTITTDADGIARVDDATGSFGAVRFASVPALRTPLHERWRTIREGDWLEPDADRTVLQLRESMPSVSLRADEPHTISVQQRLVLARLLGMFFDTDKTFLLPSAMGGIRGIKQLYDENPNSTMLVVGHTDTTGDTAHNSKLSLERAENIVAYLTDDVDPWLVWYDPQSTAGKRWGTTEDLLMIEAMPDAATRDPSEDPVRWYQRTRGLESVDGIAGPKTRRRLVEEYMSFDGTSLPPDVAPDVHGCGEHFPAVATGDEQNVQENRRVEVFFFENEVLPPAPGSTSGADAPEPPEWLRRATETHDFRPGDRVLAPILVRWHASMIALLPTDTQLSLEGEGIPKQVVAIADGERVDEDMEYAFADVDPDLPCTLTATTGATDLVLWRDQIVGRIDPPLEWEAELSSLIEEQAAEDPDEPDGSRVAIADEGEPPETVVV
jgi:outer membrane protein OmpA-like peptidoglycan-associated protein